MAFSASRFNLFYDTAQKMNALTLYARNIGSQIPNHRKFHLSLRLQVKVFPLSIRKPWPVT